MVSTPIYIRVDYIKRDVHKKENTQGETQKTQT